MSYLRWCARYCLAFAIFMTPLAHAQIQYGTAYSADKNTCLNPQPLAGVTLPAGDYCVVLTGCKPPPEGIPFLYDGTTPYPPEKTPPCDFGGGEGKLIPIGPGVHTLAAGGLQAIFTVTGPSPPEVNPTTGTKITWTNATTNSDGSPLTNYAGVRFYAKGVKVAELGPTVTSWNPPKSDLYDLVSYTTAGAESAHVQVAFTLAAPPPPPAPVDCQVSAWTSGTPGAWTPAVCATGTQTRQVPQTRTILTPASNGGAVCPALSQAITETQSCVIPAPATPRVVAVVPGANMSPVFGITSTNARGTTVLGFVPLGKPCTGPAVYSYRGAKYYRFSAGDALWWQTTATTQAAVACQ